jgi:hypothetical protein
MAKQMAAICCALLTSCTTVLIAKLLGQALVFDVCLEIHQGSNSLSVQTIVKYYAGPGECAPSILTAYFIC